MIKLSKFQPEDISRLIKWIPDARFLMQWAGPSYSYPVDSDQLMNTYEQTKGKNPSAYMFKVIEQASPKTIGHIELMAIDPQKKTAVLGRILIGLPELRGQGLGVQIIQSVLKFGFIDLDLLKISLGVFEFNRAAQRCYAKLGFQQFQVLPDYRQVGAESWTLLRMKLKRDLWLDKFQDIAD